MSSETPLVSVVIPCFNATEYIGETLDSLRGQMFRNFETIVVNDGCPDTEALERVLEPYRNEIRYLKTARAGVSAARNTGILASSARYIALLDADDKWEPDYLQVQVGILEKDSTIDLVYPDARYFGNSPLAGKTFMEVNPSTGDATMERLIMRDAAVFIGVTAKREVLIRAGLFDPQFHGVEDWDLWMRVCRTGAKITYHRQVLASYRLRPGSASDDRVALIRKSLSVCEKHMNLPELGEQERPWFEATQKKHYAMMNLLLGKQAIYRGSRSEALDLLSKANDVIKNRRVSIAILALRLAPHALFAYVHWKYPTEHAYLH